MATTCKAQVAKQLAVIGAAVAVCIVGATCGGWFLLGPTESAAAKTPDLPPGPMAVARVAAVDAKAADWHIVSVFGGEAILTMGHDLVRVKVGSALSGVGTVTAIEAGANGGGIVSGTEATLRTL